MCHKDSKGLKKSLRSPWSPAANQYFVGSLPQPLDHMACPSSFWMTPSAGRAHSVSSLDVGPVVWTPGADSAPLALPAVAMSKGRRLPRRPKRPQPRHSTAASSWTLELQLAKSFRHKLLTMVILCNINTKDSYLAPLIITRCQWTFSHWRWPSYIAYDIWIYLYRCIKYYTCTYKTCSALGDWSCKGWLFWEPGGALTPGKQSLCQEHWTIDCTWGAVRICGSERELAKVLGPLWFLVVLQSSMSHFFWAPIVLHGLVQFDILDDHSETAYMKANFEGTCSKTT